MIDLPKDYKFVDAYFTNNDRTIAEVVWSDTNDELHIEIIEAKDGDKAWERLLEHASIDNIHERTYEFIKEHNMTYEEEVIRIAKKHNLIYDVDTINSNVSVAVAKTLFKDFDAENDKEALFMFKLGLFEVPEIKEAKNKELKAKLRKAKSIIEALHVSCEICLGKS